MGSVSDLLLFAAARVRRRKEEGEEVEIRLILGVLSVLSNRTHSLLCSSPDKKEKINRILFSRHSLLSQAASFILSFFHCVPHSQKGRRGAEGFSPTDTCCDRDQRRDQSESDRRLYPAHQHQRKGIT